MLIFTDVTQDNTNEADLIADVQAAVDQALADQGLGSAGDIVVGVDGTGRFTFTLGPNDGKGVYSVSQVVSQDEDFTTAVAAADLNGDGFADVVLGNVGFDLAALLEDGVIAVTDFVEGLVIGVIDLVESGLVSLLDLIEAGLRRPLRLRSARTGLDRRPHRFRASPTSPTSCAKACSVSKTSTTWPSTPTTSSRRTSSRKPNLLANSLIDAAGNVSLNSLIASGIVFLEELIGDDLVDETALNVSDVTLGELLDTPLTELVELVTAGLVEVGDLLATVDRPPRPDRVADRVARRPRPGRAARPPRSRPARRRLPAAAADDGVRRTDEDLLQSMTTGGFGPAVVLSPDQFITTSLATGDVDEDGDIDVVDRQRRGRRAAVPERRRGRVRVRRHDLRHRPSHDRRAARRHERRRPPRPRRRAHRLREPRLPRRRRRQLRRRHRHQLRTPTSRARSRRAT